MNEFQQTTVNRNIRRAFNLFRNAIPKQHHDDIQSLMLKLAALDDLLSVAENSEVYTGPGQTTQTQGILNCISSQFYKPQSPNDVVPALIEEIVRLVRVILFADQDETCWAAVMTIEAFGYEIMPHGQVPTDTLSVIIAGKHFSLEYLSEK